MDHVTPPNPASHTNSIAAADDARRWLAGRIEWEHTLAALRPEEHNISGTAAPPPRAATAGEPAASHGRLQAPAASAPQPGRGRRLLRTVVRVPVVACIGMLYLFNRADRA